MKYRQYEIPSTKDCILVYDDGRVEYLKRECGDLVPSSLEILDFIVEEEIPED